MPTDDIRCLHKFVDIQEGTCAHCGAQVIAPLRERRREIIRDLSQAEMRDGTYDQIPADRRKGSINMPTDTELMDWLQEHQGWYAFEGDGAIGFCPPGVERSWDDSIVIQAKDHKLRSSLAEAYERFPLIAKEKADG